MRETPIVLQDVVVLCTLRDGDLLRDRQSVCQIFIWKLVQLLRVV
jgi:hypothetical protein